MTLFIAVLIGAVLGAIDGAGIFFATEEPYKLQIFLAATLKGAMVGILTFMAAHSPWNFRIVVAKGAVPPGRIAEPRVSRPSSAGHLRSGTSLSRAEALHTPATREWHTRRPTL